MTTDLADPIQTNRSKGFQRPTTTPTPDELFDVWLPVLTPAELKVLLYIVRRTFGFGKNADAISLKQICEGLVRRDGRPLDQGTGLSRKSASQAVQSLEERGLIRVDRMMADDGVNQVNIYQLRFARDDISAEVTNTKKEKSGGVVDLSNHGGVKRLHGVVDLGNYVVASGNQGVVDLGNYVVALSNPQQTDVKQQTEKSQETDVVVEKILFFGINKLKAAELFEKYPPEYILQKIQLLEQKRNAKSRGRPISDPAAWLIRAIERDYQTDKRQSSRSLNRDSAPPQSPPLPAEDAMLAGGRPEENSELWAQVLQEIELSTTKGTYQRWFPHTTLVSLDDSRAVVGVPDQATKEWLAGRLVTVVQRALQSVLERPVVAEFVIPNQQNSARAKMRS